MKIRLIGSNMTELVLDNMTIFFSYETPVAAQIKDENGSILTYKTDHKFSVTTSKHISKWLVGKSSVVITMPQEFFDNLV